MPTDRRAAFLFLGLFACFFAAYNIPSPGLGKLFASVATSVGNALVSRPKPYEGLELEFRTAYDDPRADPTQKDLAWTTILEARNPTTRNETRVHINLRKSIYVPMALFTALALAAPIWKGRRGLIVLSAGIGLLLVPILVWIIAPTLAVLYEAVVIDLGPFEQGALRFAYAVTQPPGMIYAIPFLVWAALVWRTRPKEPDAPPQTQLCANAEDG
jgi:hypothetical protein